MEGLIRRISDKLTGGVGAGWPSGLAGVQPGQEDQLSALGLVTNAVILWNTLYIEAALEQLRSEGYEVRPEDVARLSPLPNHHVNVLGRYSFSLSPQVANGGMRPLRRPDDDDGWPLA
jgi:hypothetical protein